MENFPVEVIGNILSLVGAARDVVVASCTSRKWQEAWRNHLHTLAFNSNDWPVYDEVATSSLEAIITLTIFQTKALRCLSIILKNDGFSAAPVIAWLMHTRDTLSQLHSNVDSPHANILEICGRQRLELLDLSDNTNIRFRYSYQKFPCLRSLSLARVNTSTSDLSRLLAACPKVEVLNLICLVFDHMLGPDFSIRLISNSLKDIYVEAIQSSEIILEADSLEKLHLKDCAIGTFVLLGKGTLRILELEEVTVFRLDIGKKSENLEIVEVSNFTTHRPDFHHTIVKSSKARRMGLRDVTLEEDDGNVFADIKTTSARFPQLTHLSLTYGLREALQRGLLGYRQLENVVELELRYKVVDVLSSDFVVELLGRCPKLRKFVVIGPVTGVHTPEECSILANFTSFIVRFMRKNYLHVDLQFLFV